MTQRRQVLAGLAAALLCRPSGATPESMRAALAAFTGAATLRDGRVRLELSTLVENGNAVPVSLSVDGAAAGEVRRMALFTERNPQPDVAVFEFGPLSGGARVATRMRLATSQTVVAVAQMADGSCWQHRIDVLVTLAACVEGG